MKLRGDKDLAWGPMSAAKYRVKPMRSWWVWLCKGKLPNPTQCCWVLRIRTESACLRAHSGLFSRCFQLEITQTSSNHDIEVVSASCSWRAIMAARGLSTLHVGYSLPITKEFPFPHSLLSSFLALPASSHAHLAAPLGNNLSPKQAGPCFPPAAPRWGPVAKLGGGCRPQGWCAVPGCGSALVTGNGAKLPSSVEGGRPLLLAWKFPRTWGFLVLRRPQLQS